MKTEAWLHIRSQLTYHSEASIAGTLEGLQAVKAALDTAIKSGEGRADLLASDGEGYSLVISRSSTIAGIGAPTYLDEEARRIACAERQYLVRESRSIRKQAAEALEALRWCRANGNPHKEQHP